ncbi:tyrosine-type recombinase/integrase, partial [Niveibacterium sp.]|uniref:tyrosine-type recombinase/integrase n=1 Tax=Niveibacterium sp. TaxID=2017444 RepID=UPI0035ADBCC5
MDNALSLLLELASTNSQSVDSVARLLSAAKVRTVKSGAKPIKLADGGGLVLYVTPSGTKSWRYRFRLGGKEQTLTIGSYPEVSLEEARQAHRAARWLVERGHAPLVYLETQLQSRSDAKALAERHSFDAVCRDWLAATKGNLSSTTVRHRQQMLDKHVLPIVGKRPIAAITRKELRDLLLGIDKDAPVTARHCRIYIKQVFDWALDAELVQGNPVPKATSLPNQASRRSVPRRALPVSALGSFLRTIEDAKTSDVLTRTALWLLVLTWSRTAEVICAKWIEFDLLKGVWTIPAERMKAREAH